MSSAEEEIAVPVRGDDNGVALHTLIPDVLPDAGETCGAVDLVEHEARKLDDEIGR